MENEKSQLKIDCYRQNLEGGIHTNKDLQVDYYKEKYRKLQSIVNCSKCNSK